MMDAALSPWTTLKVVAVVPSRWKHFVTSLLKVCIVVMSRLYGVQCSGWVCEVARNTSVKSNGCKLVCNGDD